MRALLGSVGALLAASPLLLACGDGAPPPPDDEEAGEATPAEAGVTPARYATSLAFVGYPPDSVSVYFHFLNETGSSFLARRYRVWSHGAGRWRTALAISDTIPSPRAAWRVLPGPGLRVTVADGEELASLIHPDSARPFRLAPGEPITGWLGATGQREGLRRARLLAGDRSVDGLLVERRSARPLRSPVPPSVRQLFLLTYRGRDGLLLLRDEGGPDSPVVGHTWIEGEETTWNDVILDRREGEGGSAWNLRLPEAGIRGELTLGAVAVDSLPEGGAGLRVASLEGTVRVDGGAWPARGLFVESRGP